MIVLRAVMLATLSASVAAAQKPAIDIHVLGKWPFVDDPRISHDGQYVAYTIERQPLNSRTLVVRGTETSWRREFVGINEFDPYFFSADNKQLAFARADTLYFVMLGTSRVNSVAGISSYHSPGNEDGEWLAYHLTNNELVVRNVVQGTQKRFSHVVEYKFADTGNVLFVKTESTRENVTTTTLKWIPLPGEPLTIWSDESTAGAAATPRSFVLDGEGNQLSFVVEETFGNHKTNTLWYYRAGMQQAVRKVHERSPGVEPGLLIAGSPEFSRNGRWLFFRLQPPLDERRPVPNAVKLDIWSYKDLVVQPEQMRRQNEGGPTFAAVVGTEDNQVIRLEQEGERVQTYPEDVTGDFVVLNDNDDVPYWWQFAPQSSFYLLSLHDGSRTLLRREAGRNALTNFSISPRGKYLVYWDAGQTSYFSYEIAAAKTRNLTKAIPSQFSKPSIYRVDEASIKPIAPVAGWHQTDSSMLIYDWHDIWQIDPSMAQRPVNITNGHGRAQNIQLRLAYGPGGIGDKSPITFGDREPLLLTAFSPATKANGFYRMTLGKKGDPQQLTMGPYTWYRVESQKPHFASFGDGMRPLKARAAQRWIVKRHSATEAPDYFWTTDFRSYTNLSELQPHRNYNWLTSELISWQQLDGTTAQGILYKPENFDASRKYPIIFNYYRQLSHRLHEFPYPYFTGDNINIPWFVSNGYLVFTPDIHYAVTEKIIGESVYNSVVSAAQHLATLPFVDAKRMGLQGHSFGGHQTNYLITRTGLFAAAAEFAGVSDPLSNFLTLAPFLSEIEHSEKLSRVETTAGATPWERPDLYSSASAVLNAHRVTTPLLITHNIRDGQIQWRQGVELYMALRRLGKKVWLLQYDGGTHALFGRDAADYTLRLTQFFDHYLKGAAPPKWMTEGVAARLKGVETGLELDTSGKKP